MQPILANVQRAPCSSAQPRYVDGSRVLEHRASYSRSIGDNRAGPGTAGLADAQVLGVVDDDMCRTTGVADAGDGVCTASHIQCWACSLSVKAEATVPRGVSNFCCLFADASTAGNSATDAIAAREPLPSPWRDANSTRYVCGGDSSLSGPKVVTVQGSRTAGSPDTT